MLALFYLLICLFLLAGCFSALMQVVTYKKMSHTKPINQTF